MCVGCAKLKGWPGEACQVLELGAPFMEGGGQDAFRLKLIRVDLGGPQRLGTFA